ncbi:hypothetical protein F4778DRAFT_478097 [Xylariomycetidae sp. FL2044]|nr:hypothetical protein F4778DRAFT_478097 [Xylariomycetidae sp. FL2044]
MPQTRSGAKTVPAPLRDSADVESTASRNNDSGHAKDLKRKSRPHNDSEASRKDKKAKSDDSDEPTAQDEQVKPRRLTTPDLEFDYDRSQLRDPRPTPGRKARPRKEGREIDDDFKKRFFIPEPKKPKGRLNAMQKNDLFGQEALLDPSHIFHDLYVCHKKGPRGSPTYDSAGFQLDWKKVNNWMKPQAYSKSAAVNGMERRLAKDKKEEEEMFGIFFVDGVGPDAVGADVRNYVSDHVSKDLGLPFHQIGPRQLRDWEARGFEKKAAADWWREPNPEERKRMLKMLSGGSLRKDL